MSRFDKPAVVAISTEPPTRKPTPQKYDWAAIREQLEANPGLWLQIGGEFSTGQYSYVRAGKPLAFQGMGGQLEITLRNQRPRTPKRGEAKGKGRVGDLWLRWTPEAWTEDDQARVDALHTPAPVTGETEAAS